MLLDEINVLRPRYFVQTDNPHGCAANASETCDRGMIDVTSEHVRALSLSLSLSLSLTLSDSLCRSLTLSVSLRLSLTLCLLGFRVCGGNLQKLD